MAARRNPDPASEGSLPISLHRLINFSDAVFAIAATLLVIDLRPPQTSSDVYEQALLDYLGQPGPFIATTIGFLVVGSFWSSHRQVLGLAKGTSDGLVWANLLFLFGVAIQPFLTAALAEHDPNRTSVVLYAGGQLATCLAQLVVWRVLLRNHELLTERATPHRTRFVTYRLLVSPAAFGLSIPIAFVIGPTAAMASWGLIVVLAVAVTSRLGEPRPSQAVPAGACRNEPGRRPRRA